MSTILEWITVAVPTNLKIIGETNLNIVLERENVVLIIFLDESTPHLNAALNKVILAPPIFGANKWPRNNPVLHLNLINRLRTTWS